MSGKTTESVRQVMERRAADIGRAIGEELPDGTLFALVVMEEGPAGWCTYISNARREDVILMMRELADTVEAMEDQH